MNAAAQRTVPLAESADPDGFFQSAVSDSRLALVLAFVGEPSIQLRAQLEEAARPVAVEIRIVDHSWSQLRALSDRIGTDRPYWSTQGAELSSWGPDWMTNKVRIALVRFDRGAAQALEVHYGSDLVEVEEIDAGLARRC